MKNKIAYIDEDKGWINTFYQTFKQDFEIVKIQVSSDLSIESIIDKLLNSQVEAIVTDYLLEENGEVEFNGNKIVEEVRGWNPHFPIVMLTSHASQAISHTDDVHIIYSKDILAAENEKEREELEIFKIKIKSNIDYFKKKIYETESRIDMLVLKRQETELDIFEEEELSKLYIMLDEICPENKSLPANLISRPAIFKLNEFVNDTKEILEQLKKMNGDKSK